MGLNQITNKGVESNVVSSIMGGTTSDQIKYTLEHDEKAEKALLTVSLQKLIGDNPSRTVSKEIEKKYWNRQTGFKRHNVPLNKKKTGWLFSKKKPVDYIPEKYYWHENLYKEIVGNDTVSQKYEDFVNFIDTWIGKDNWNEKYGGELEIPPQKAELLYTVLQDLQFPWWCTDNYGNLIGQDGFFIRVFSPDWSPIVLLIYKDKILQWYYDEW